MEDFESRICAQTQKLHIIKTFHMSRMNPKKSSTQYYILSSTTIHCRPITFNPTGELILKFCKKMIRTC